MYILLNTQQKDIFYPKKRCEPRHTVQLQINKSFSHLELRYNEGEKVALFHAGTSVLCQGSSKAMEIFNLTESTPVSGQA